MEENRKTVTGKETNICYTVNVFDPKHVWQTRNVLKDELPEIATSIAFIVLLSRIIFFIFKPIHQSRMISYITVSI